mgnify:CR=1 FL=1
MVSIWSPLLLTLHTKALIQNVLRGEKLSVCVPPGQSVADGGWDVIIIELKQYLQAITSCSFDPGPSFSLDPIYLASAVTSGHPRAGQHKIKPKWKSRRRLWWFVQTNNECADEHFNFDGKSSRKLNRFLPDLDSTKVHFEMNPFILFKAPQFQSLSSHHMCIKSNFNTGYWG